LRLGGYVLELLAHLDTGPDGALQVVGLSGLEPTARSELSQRLGVGAARVVAETRPIGLVDRYSLDALSRASAGPRVVRRGASGKRPDFVGSNAAGDWSVLEAKARTAKGTLPGTRARAHSQAQAVDFRDARGRIIPIELRIGSVARLGPAAVDVWFEDPRDLTVDRVYESDPDELLFAYYQPVRDLIDVYGRRLRGVSGAESFGSAPLPQSSASLIVHQGIMEVLDDPDALRAVRAEFQDEFAEYQADAVDAEDRTLSVGQDGLGLLIEVDPVDLASWFRELREI